MDWHLEPVSGKRAPLAHWSRIDYLDPAVAGDKKFTWELNRHQHFQTLGCAYWRTNDERFAEAFVAHLSAWADANPPKLGVNWASSLEVSVRAISWLWALHFFRESERLTPEVFLRALKLLHLHARHLETYLSTYFSPNTHLTGEALGLFYTGTVFPEFRRAARWRELGASVLTAELDRHVRADGTYFEQSTYYARYTADFYAHFVALARASAFPLDPKVERKLAALAEFLMFTARPDGRAPLFGDDDGGRLSLLDDTPRDDFRPTLATCAALLGRADFKFVAGGAAEETLWLLGAEGLAAFDRIEAREPSAGSRAFPDGGFYVMRDGWARDASFLMLDCGPHGALNCGHAHADALSFELSARGRALVVDPGTYTYTGDAAARDAFRSSPAHNALAVAGESSSQPGGPFTWATVARAKTKTWTSHARFDYFEGGHDGYARLAPAASVSRAVLFLKGDYFVMRDRVAAARGARHACALRLHLAPGASPALDAAGGAASLRFPARPADPRVAAAVGGDGPPADDGAGAGAGLDLSVFGAGGAWREEAGWVSRCYGSRERAPVLSFEAETSGGGDFYTFLLPRADGAGAGRVRRLEATGGHLFEIERGGGGDYDVLLASAGSYAESGRFASDFEWAWARFSNQGATLEELVLINGRRFSLYGQEIVRLANRASFVVARRDGDQLALETGAERKSVKLSGQTERAVSCQLSAKPNQEHLSGG
ncbi:MAG: heparinase II/III family protein [Acidobacteria bacterium]|nr:heparinase II/III family protein [Acidobacteriota bacterium]